VTKNLDRRHWAFTVTFMVAYAILTGTDAASTLQGIDSGVAQEANPHVGGEPGAFELGRFLWINGAMLLVLTGMLVWSLGSRDRIDPRYLDRPRLAFWNWVYLNPFSARTVPRSAFHCIANPICILGLKGLATVNNLLIAKGLPDPITPLAHGIQGLAPGWLAYWILIFLLWLPFWWPSLAIAAWFLRSGQRTGVAVGAIPATASQ
jgi:hypothetical protein